MVTGLRMKTLAIMSQKGGSGKTTLAIYLATRAGRRFPTVLFDLDPQQSALKWARRQTPPRELAIPVLARGERIEDATVTHLPLDVAALDPRQLGARLRQLAATTDTELAIIDTSPRADAHAALVAQLADLVLIPCRPGVFDLDAVGATVEIARIARKPAAIVINASSPLGRLASEAAAALRAAGYTVLDEIVHHRVAFAHALIGGQAIDDFAPRSKAAAEIEALFRQLALQLGLPSRRRPSHKNPITAATGLRK